MEYNTVYKLDKQLKYLINTFILNYISNKKLNKSDETNYSTACSYVILTFGVYYNPFFYFIGYLTNIFFSDNFNFIKSISDKINFISNTVI